MSWSQIKGQARLAAEQRLRDQVMAWRISREPHLAKEHRDELGREFRARQAHLDALARQVGCAPRGGVNLRQLEAAFGGMERKYKLPDGTFVDADEWDREHGKGQPDGDSQHAGSSSDCDDRCLQQGHGEG